MITQTKRSTADFTVRHAHYAAWALWCQTGDGGVANRSLLVGGISCGVGHRHARGLNPHDDFAELRTRGESCKRVLSVFEVVYRIDGRLQRASIEESRGGVELGVVSHG